MINEIQEMIGRLNELVEITDNALERLAGVTEEVSRVLNATVVFVDETGKIIVKKEIEEKFKLNLKQTQDGEYIDNQLNNQLKNVVETKSDVDFTSLYIKNYGSVDLKNFAGMISPFNNASKRIGSAIVYRENKVFTSDDKLIMDFATLISTIIFGYVKDEIDSEDSRRGSIVKSAIDTLSYSELEAILYIFEELNGLEGLLIASKVADRVGITRSVIVNGLRKLESAGVIESRSLGMKGTYIKVLNSKLIDEINKLRS